MISSHSMLEPEHTTVVPEGTTTGGSPLDRMAHIALGDKADRVVGWPLDNLKLIAGGIGGTILACLTIMTLGLFATHTRQTSDVYFDNKEGRYKSVDTTYSHGLGVMRPVVFALLAGTLIFAFFIISINIFSIIGTVLLIVCTLLASRYALRFNSGRIGERLDLYHRQAITRRSLQAQR